ncbi:hypothetical protein ID866_1872 [Astraeus odoratus]|nr:hypothetical protein ID866_1872 [Astraeus odoratus]
MPAQRTRQPPPITCVPRSTVDPLLHKDVDGLLKDLKFASRRIQTAGVSFVDEMRILERLYYKNKNQHRSAPFFKRMSEIRRYGQRLVELNVWERAELLRTSFFGLTTIADINQKATKGAWSFIPDIAHVSFVLERLQSCSVLVNKVYHSQR